MSCKPLKFTFTVQYIRDIIQITTIYSVFESEVDHMQYDGLLTIATGSSRRCTNWKNKRILWSDLAAKLSNVTRTQETQAEYERMPKDERDRIKDVGGFVGGSLRTNRRKADSVCERQLITLDLDNVPQDTDPWPTVTLALGCAAVLYSTHSHTPRSPRLRLVLVLLCQPGELHIAFD